ncbi:hypothetical protein SYNPS1DRAFT_27498 [Syncephalis pseudoplumigaleata]|uniref:Uncharacterized protein n=1 Tax=Syncephalis pseudoplumigaleata TaxID=1712513 RepID=A0A4P9Z4P5_9FUNG|nr:hypothetical protein SYNPS1DRAFT_27498 [Syncephalis pseudoplumigaleata]|eukprot:RKP26821.1 hypothetical protein SYNPS1DRAFT_27498 [Syncephalis pseudoplumigaleata]
MSSNPLPPSMLVSPSTTGMPGGQLAAAAGTAAATVAGSAAGSAGQYEASLHAGVTAGAMCTRVLDRLEAICGHGPGKPFADHIVALVPSDAQAGHDDDGAGGAAPAATGDLA